MNLYKFLIIILLYLNYINYFLIKKLNKYVCISILLYTTIYIYQWYLTKLLLHSLVIILLVFYSIFVNKYLNYLIYKKLQISLNPKFLVYNTLNKLYFINVYIKNFNYNYYLKSLFFKNKFYYTKILIN